MKGTIKLIPATEIAEGKKVIYGGWAASIMNYADSMTCDISIKNLMFKDKKRVYISDLKILVIEYHTKQMPADPTFVRGYSLTKYNHDMALYDASMRTIILNPKHWQSAMDLNMVNKKINFTDEDGMANFVILHEMGK